MSSGVRSAALRFLKIRPRSVFELTQKLYEKGFEHHDVDEVIRSLIAAKLLDDRVFADAWIRYRLARPFGFVRIVRELQEKGISSDIIESAIVAAKEQYNHDDVMMELMRRKLSRMSHVPIEKQKKRLSDFLIRRGFNIGDVFKSVSKIGKDHVKYQ